MFGRGIPATDITDFGLKQAIGLGGKALLIAQTRLALTLDHRAGEIRARHNSLQISLKTIMANPVIFERVVEMIHID
jgi:hypothetical protein